MMKAYSAKDLWAYEDMLYTLQSALNTAKVYEVFTKDEVIVMLTELHKEIMEMSTIDICPYAIDNCIDRIEAEILIKEKINKLKENK